VFAEFETNLRRERQLEGIAKAKAAARLIAGANGLDGGAAFAEGHELDPERAAKVPAK
jgi:DNA invertase Pin-like site-specific DNA recombinase